MLQSRLHSICLQALFVTVHMTSHIPLSGLLQTLLKPRCSSIKALQVLVMEPGKAATCRSCCPIDSTGVLRTVLQLRLAGINGSRDFANAFSGLGSLWFIRLGKLAITALSTPRASAAFFHHEKRSAKRDSSGATDRTDLFAGGARCAPLDVGRHWPCC